MTDFFDRTGKMAIGSRLRRLTDRITADAAEIYRKYGVEMRPKWFPVVYALADGEPRTVTAIAREIGHTHPSVSLIVKELKAHDMLSEVPNRGDRRCNAVSLSEKGRTVAEALNVLCGDMAEAIDRISAEATHDLWRAIEEWEMLLDERSVFRRVQEVRRERESRSVEIVPYEARYQPVFRRLNEQWITEHWTMEEADYKYLDDPQRHILDPGGHILVALYQGQAAGVCALLKMEDERYDFELAKFAVDREMRGKGIGLLLGEAALAKARELGARKLFLESNTILRPAIHIYRKLGFRELREYAPAYVRGDIQMELTL